MKSFYDEQNILRFVSLPLRGAWIEINMLIKAVCIYRSLPLRGAWIEISMARIGFLLS